MKDQKDEKFTNYLTIFSITITVFPVINTFILGLIFSILNGSSEFLRFFSINDIYTICIGVFRSALFFILLIFFLIKFFLEWYNYRIKVKFLLFISDHLNILFAIALFLYTYIYREVSSLFISVTVVTFSFIYLALLDLSIYKFITKKLLDYRIIFTIVSLYFASAYLHITTEVIRNESFNGSIILKNNKIIEIDNETKLINYGSPNIVLFRPKQKEILLITTEEVEQVSLKY